MFQSFIVTAHSGVALPHSEQQQLNALLAKLKPRTTAEEEEIRRFLLRLWSMEPLFTPPVSDLLVRAQQAVFWHDCRYVRTLGCTATHTIEDPQRLLGDVASLGILHVIPLEFWGELLSIVDDAFLSLLHDRLEEAMKPLLHPSLLHISSVSVLTCLNYALASHFDSVLLQRGMRFSAYFDLFFKGNLIVGYDIPNHEVIVLVGPS